MPEDTSLSQIQTSITSGATTLTNLLNLAPGPTAVAGFIADGVFKAIKLGIAIRKAAQRANADLKTKIQAQSILRTPIVVNLSLLELQSFYGNTANFVAFPAFAQFEREILEFRNTGGNPSPDTFSVLTAAKALVPALQNDPDLSHNPELADIFSISMEPFRDKPIRDVVLSSVKLFSAGELTTREHADRLSNFWKDQLVISLGAIDRAQLDAQATLDAAVRTLVTNAIFDPQTGMLASSLDLVKKLKKASIDEQIADLTRKKEAATAQADKDKLQSHIDELTAFEKRLG
jgi:hypothetical protein